MLPFRKRKRVYEEEKEGKEKNELWGMSEMCENTVIYFSLIFFVHLKITNRASREWYILSFGKNIHF